jgi:tetratricopeptide (TPR) repeat protein
MNMAASCIIALRSVALAIVLSTNAADTRLSDAFKALYAGDPDRALRLSSEYLKEHSIDLNALVLAARAQIARDDYDAAFDLLRKALAIDARNPDVLYFLGIVSGQLATRAFDRLGALAPDGARVHQLLAQSFRLQEKPVEAAAEYELALKANPASLDALLEFAELRREESNCDEALALYERAERVKPTFEGAFGLGVCLARQFDHAQAVEQFRRALKHDVRSAPAYFELGSSLLRLGDAAAAAGALEHAVRLEPRMRQAYYVLGRAYQAMGLAARAQQAFARADALARSEREGDVKALGAHPAPRRAPVPPKIPQ